MNSYPSYGPMPNPFLPSHMPQLGPPAFGGCNCPPGQCSCGQGHICHCPPGQCSCDTSYLESTNVLVNRILDTIRRRQNNCVLSIPIPSVPRQTAVCFLSAAICGRAVLRDIKITPAYGRVGCQMCATIVAPISVCLLIDGCEQSFQSEICIPITAIVRAPIGQICEWVVQLNARLYNGQWCNASLDICMDYEVVLYAIAPTVIKMAQRPPSPICPTLPLYPQ